MDFELDTLMNLPVVPLRGLVLFPKMLLHFDVGRKKTTNAVKHAMETDQYVFLATQKDITVDEPTEDDLSKVGVIARVKQIIKSPNGESIRVVVEGLSRGKITVVEQHEPFISAGVEKVVDSKINARLKALQEGYMRIAKSMFERYSSMLPKMSNEIIVRVMSIDEPGELADFICYNTNMPYTSKQIVLDEKNPVIRLNQLCVELEKENNNLETELQIQSKLQLEIDKNQREYYLREEMKVIASELGDGEDTLSEADDYRQKISALDVDETIKTKLSKECDRLFKMAGASQESAVIRTYLDTCLDLPFGKYTTVSIDLEKAKKLLDKEHFGLDKVKTRIIEALAVRKLSPNINGQIICLVGPPGVGKTSIAKSLAKAMGKNYTRISLGGVHDEAEIRGHRRTYVGSMPGKIVSAIRNAKSMNAFVLLDEIDKLGNDAKGDPSSALLEALDPEQNNTFTDHYIDFPINLSKTMFVTTANDISSIPEPLLDRMEVIELYSYTHQEKFNIAKKHLIKKQLKRHGLNGKNTKINDDALHMIIDFYTREAGVRNLERVITDVLRKSACSLINGECEKFVLTKNNIEDVLGPKKYKSEKTNEFDEIGCVNGLAWTRVGGTMLPIEISALEGTGKIELTGNLGDVMKESAKTAVSFVRSRAEQLYIDKEFYKNKDIHIHAPESAVPKDGPSAGVAITTALVSELTNTPIKHNVAMTGEISLKGKVLAIGGLKEKSMAAYRAGIKKVIIPYDNKSDLSQIDDIVKESVEFYPVKTYDEVMAIAFTDIKSNYFNKTKIIQKSADNQQVVAQ